jgi:hypothetical protein
MALIAFIGSNAHAASTTVQACCSSKELAFARYITSQEERDPFLNSGAVGVVIEASLPGLYKEAALFGVRARTESDQGDLKVLEIEGDGTVVEEVIDRYFALRKVFDALPISSVAVTPSNYKFEFAGEVKTGGAAEAYMYNITPRKSRPGLLAGQIWVDSATGNEIMLSGHLLAMPASTGLVNIVRDTKLLNGSAFARITHVTFAIPQLGRAELAITEIMLNPGNLPQPGDLQPGDLTRGDLMPRELKPSDLKKLGLDGGTRW